MASLMNPACHSPSALLPRIHKRRDLCRIGWCGLILMITGTLNTASYADDASVEMQSPAPTPVQPSSAWDWSLLDWKTLDQLTPAQKAKVPVACCGTFLEPEDMQQKTGTTSTSKQSNASPSDSLSDNEDISVTGANSQMTKQSTIVTGDVMLIQGQRKISGDHAELFNDPQGAHLEGNVLFREPGFLLQGNEADINLEQNTLHVEKARYVLHVPQVHGEATTIQRDSAGVVTLTDSTYSACTPGDELWFLKSSSMTLDPANGQGRATNVRVEVFDIPIFYFPYLIFPIGGQRHSGFLGPSISTGQNGVDISLPYYLNLAPNYDATIVPRYISDRGTQLGGEFRHLSSSFNSAASATWMSHDQQLDENRWLLGLKQTGGQYQPWSTLVDVTRVSDKDYFNDLDNSGLSVSRATNLQQRGSAGYVTDHWDTHIEVLEYQILRDSAPTDPFRKLPELSTTGDYALGNGFSTQLSQSITRFEHGDQNQIDGNRLRGDYRLDWRSDWQAGYVIPAVEMHYLEQTLNNTTGITDPRVTIPAANLDMGLILVRDGSQYQQTLEPRLYYQYAGYKNQNDFQLFDTDEMNFGYSQLFRNFRFSGNDRIADANQTSVGVTSRWLDKANGEEWLQVGVGQIFYYKNRNVTAYDPATFALLPQNVQDQYTNSQSPIASELQWSINPLWRLSTELDWSEQDHQNNGGNIFLHYQNPIGALVSVGFRYVQLLNWTGTAYQQETDRQSDLSAYWPITDQWALVGRANYDFTNSRYLERLAGFQYEDCCWKLRAVFRQWATNPDEVSSVAQQPAERGLYFEIEFKNLAGIGTKTDSMLKDSIYGYEANGYDKNEHPQQTH